MIDWAVQAVDGTKVMGNAAAVRIYDKEGLEQILERTEKAILDLEAQNEGSDDSPPPNLPKELRQAQQLRERVREVRRGRTGREGPRQPDRPGRWLHDVTPGVCAWM